MHSMTRKASLAAVLALATWTAACSSPSSSPTEPGLPSTTGATIQGTVNAGVNASSVSTSSSSSAAPIRVTVIGTSLTTATDGSGRFVLAGVPSGRADLRFEGPGIDARLTLSGLADGQVLTIEVQVAGANARVVSGPSSSPSPSPRPSPSPSASPRPSPRPTPSPEPEQEVEFRGSVQSITPPSLVVAGQAVRTDAATRIRRNDRAIGLTDLRIGELVEVEGNRQSDGSILARKIKVEDDQDDDDDDDDDEGDDDLD